MLCGTLDGTTRPDAHGWAGWKRWRGNADLAVWRSFVGLFLSLVGSFRLFGLFCLVPRITQLQRLCVRSLVCLLASLVAFGCLVCLEWLVRLVCFGFFGLHGRFRWFWSGRFVWFALVGCVVLFVLAAAAGAAAVRGLLLYGGCCDTGGAPQAS